MLLGQNQPGSPAAQKEGEGNTPRKAKDSLPLSSRALQILRLPQERKRLLNTDRVGGNGGESLIFTCPLWHKIGCEKSEFGEVLGAHAKQGCWAGRKGRWEHQCTVIRCMLGLTLGGISSLLLLWLGRKKYMVFQLLVIIASLCTKCRSCMAEARSACRGAKLGWITTPLCPQTWQGNTLPSPPLPCPSFSVPRPHNYFTIRNCQGHPITHHKWGWIWENHLSRWTEKASKTLCYSKPAIIIHKCKEQKKSLTFPSHKNVLPVKAAFNRQCIFSHNEAESSVR